jgi:hypothetical protein
MAQTKINRLVSVLTRTWRDFLRGLGFNRADRARQGGFRIKPGTFRPVKLTMMYPTRWRVAPAPRALNARDLSELHALHGRRLLSDGKSHPHATVPRDSHLSR